MMINQYRKQNNDGETRDKRLTGLNINMKMQQELLEVTSCAVLSMCEVLLQLRENCCQVPVHCHNYALV